MDLRAGSPAVERRTRQAILELIARPPPQRCPRCRKWIRSEKQRVNKSAKVVLGGIIKFDGPDRVGQYFLERWGEGIIRAHTILERFLVFRRKSARNSYEDFTWLFEQATSIDRNN
jgi:hypothetical protein